MREFTSKRNDIAQSLFSDVATVSEDALREDVTISLEAGEIWAAGVTYAISEEARESTRDAGHLFRRLQKRLS